MATKAELQEEVNDMLGTNMEFSKMRSDDLELLRDLIDEGALLEPQLKHVAKEHGKSALEQQIDDWRPGQVIGRLLQ